MFITAAVLFGAMFGLVAGKAWQQLNVTQGRGAFAILPASLFMGLMEVLIITNVSRSGELWTALPVGVGGGLGCLLAMSAHRWAFGYSKQHIQPATESESG